MEGAPMPARGNAHKLPANSRHKVQPIDPPADPLDWPLLAFLHQVYLAERPGCSPRTVADYRMQVLQLQKFFDHQLQTAGQPTRPLLLRDLRDLGNAFLGSAMAWKQKQGYAAATVNK